MRLNVVLATATVAMAATIYDVRAADTVPGSTAPRMDYDVQEDEPWRETEAELPSAPKERELVEFYVSATTTNRFFVDAASVSVGPDNVVRYTLVVKAPSGATNVTYEGMRCETKQKRVYAFGRPDGSWSQARGAKWADIEEATMNRQHSALRKEYFCPNGMSITNAEEGVFALRRGGHPQVDGK